MKAALCVALMLVGSQAFADCSKDASKYRSQIVREAQFRFGIPAPTAVIIAQMRQESDCNPNAVSKAGAKGLMQFMPNTATWANTAGAFGSVEPFNPLWSIRAGVWYDRWLFDRISTFDSICDKWHFILSSYNGGLGYVYKRQKKSYYPGKWDLTGYINPGISPSNQRENQTYSTKILYTHQPKFKHWGGSVCLN